MTANQGDNSIATVGCEGCNNEVTVPVDQSHCPICGAMLWEDDELPAPIERFVKREIEP